MTGVAVFLVPNGYEVPLLSGETELPEELEWHAVARTDQDWGDDS